MATHEIMDLVIRSASGHVLLHALLPLWHPLQRVTPAVQHRSSSWHMLANGMHTLTLH
jgi:hypothetical protein